MKKFFFLGLLLGGFTFVKSQSNDPCGAPVLPVGTTCVNTAGTLPATATNTTGVPAPGCASYSGPDVWYSLTVPASGSITINMNTAAGGPTDMGMAIYSGACGSLSLVECDDDDGAGLMPTITRTGLTPGSTLYVRVWEYGGGSFGNFVICVQEAASSGCTSSGPNSTCAAATPFCSSIPVNYCNTTGVPSLGGGGIYGCLGSTPNPAFFYLNIGTSGAIDILITQTAATGGAIDVDFVLWGPFATQAAMCPGMTAANIIDCSYSGSATETINIPSTAVAGQWYLLLVTNFSGVSGSVAYSQVGGTGATDCSITTPCSISGMPTHVSCFGGTGSITANATGTAPYTVNVVNAGGTVVATQTGAGPSFNFPGLAAGTYTLNVTSSSGTPACTNTSTVTINGPAAALSASSSHTDVLCSGGCTGTLNASASGGTPPYAFSWSGGLGAGASKVNVCAGTYTVTVTDANGCTNTSSQTIADPSFTLTTATTDELCGATDGTVSASAVGAGTITLTWYSDSSMTSSIGTGSPITGLDGGTYYLNASSTTGCTTSTSVTVNSPSVPELGVIVDQNATGFGLCNGSATGSVTGGVAPITFAWTDGDAGSTDNTLCAGTNCLTITDANGCADDTCITITEPALLVTTLTGTNPLCFNSCDGSIATVTTGGVPPYTYNWSNGAYTSDVSTLCAGTYSLAVTDANGNTASASHTLTDPAQLVVNPATVTHVSCNAACDGTISITATGGTGTLTYGIPGLTGGPDYNSVCAGNYVLTVTDANGCSSPQGITISEPPALFITMSSVNASCIFPNGSATANVNGGEGPYSYLWSNGATTAVNSNITSGIYSVDVTDANGCMISGTVVVGNNPPLVITPGPHQTICIGQTSTMTAAASGGSGGPYTFNWTDENGAPISSTTTGFVTAATVNPTDSTMYFVTVDDGCVASVTTDTVFTFVNPLPTISFVVSEQAGCSPFTTNFQVNTDIGQSFLYDFECDGISNESSENAFAQYTYIDAGTYDVCVTAVSPYGCRSSASEMNMVTAYPRPVAGFVATPSTTSILEPEIMFTNISTGGTFYTWSFGDSTGASGVAGNSIAIFPTTGSIDQPVHVYQDTGTYMVTLVVENSYGCTDEITHPVVIEPDYEIFVPNAFTPNADGLNDVFLPSGIGYNAEKYELYIFDRWGQVIFKTTTFTTGWDGRHNGINCKSDTYIWKVLVKDFKNIRHTYEGSVTLLR